MPFKGGRTDGKTVRRTRGGNISPYYFTVNSSAKRSVSIHALAHSRREGGKGEEIRKNERSIDIYFGKGAAGKKQPLRAQSFNALGNGKRTASLRKWPFLTAADRQTGPALCLGHDRGMTSALIDIFVNRVKKSM